MQHLLNVFGTDENSITALQTKKLRAPTMFASPFVPPQTMKATSAQGSTNPHGEVTPTTVKFPPFLGSVQSVRTPLPNHTISAKCPLSIVFHIRKAAVGAARSWPRLASRPRQRSFTTLRVTPASTEGHIRTIFPEQMTTYAKQKQNFLLDIKCDPHQSNVGWEAKECG